MWKWLWRRLLARYEWLSPAHPVAVRDNRWLHRELPLTLRRLNNPWAMFGYAAVCHGVLFVIAILTYHYLSTTLAGALVPMLSPFLTPFGTPLAAGFLHSVLYWALLIGLCNQTTLAFAREFESGAWQVLRLTPYPTHTLFLAKLAAVARNWSGILRTLLIVRLLALLILPIAVASGRAREAPNVGGLDVLSALIFMAQPFAEVLMALGIAALAGVFVRGALWARMYAYGALAVTLGALNGLGSLWLTFTSAIGGFAALLVPMGHWTALAAAVSPPKAPLLYGLQTVLLVVLQVVLPALLGALALRLALRAAARAQPA
jgi:hypothetical protein